MGNCELILSDFFCAIRLYTAEYEAKLLNQHWFKVNYPDH